MSESLIELAEGTEQLPNMSLSSEQGLIKACPQTFFSKDNPWTIFATKVSTQGTSLKGWSWKRGDDYVRATLFGLFAILGQSPTMHPLEKCAVKGWILSEILESIPEHLPLQKTN